MRVREIMSEPVTTVPAIMRLKEARDLMRGLQLHHLIVKDRGTVVGVLSASDIADARLSDAPNALRVNDVMSGNVASIDQNETVRHAASLIQGRNSGCLAVMQHGKLVGIVTVADLLRLLAKGGDRPAAKSRPDLHYRVPHRKQRNGSPW